MLWHVTLKRVANRVDVDKEIKYLNDEYVFVSEERLPAFTKELTALYQFECDRKLSSINQIAYAKFRLFERNGSDSLTTSDAQLCEDLKGLSGA